MRHIWRVLGVKRKDTWSKTEDFQHVAFRMVSCQIKSNTVWLKSADNKP